MKLSSLSETLSEKDIIETYFQVINKDREEVPFLFNPIQCILEKSWEMKNVILKARKLGISILVQAKFLVRCLTQKNRNCVILSFDKDATQRQLERTVWTLDHLPFKIGLERDSRNEFMIKSTNSKLFVGTPGTKAFGRGSDITDLHLTEFAYWEDTSAMTGLMEALTNDAFVAVESTANGSLNDFAKLWRKAVGGQSEWKAHFFPWWMDDELERTIPNNFILTEEEKILMGLYPKMNLRKLAWRRWKIESMFEPELFQQEYPASPDESFISIGDTIFNKKSLLNYSKIVTPANHMGYLSA